MSPTTLKTTSHAVKKRRSPLTVEERAGLEKIKVTPAAVTPRGRSAAARFLKFKKTNPGW
jgi:hypothetical protein